MAGLAGYAGAAGCRRRDRLFATYVRTLLARRRSKQHSARQTVRWLAFLADRMQRESRTVFTLELLNKDAVLFWTGRFVPPTERSSLICGLAGGSCSAQLA